jgi:RNA polymerase sigma-70 factor (ECF subfamily)
MDPDEALAGRLVRREMAALKEAYERHGERVQRLCLRLLGRRADAEDAAQEVFLKLFERGPSFDGRARFSTWLHRLTVNLCLSRMERERLRSAHALPEGAHALADASGSPDDALSRTEAREALQQLLGRLSSEHRSVLVLRELEQLSYQEIAAALAIPEGTVMSRLSRARAELARLAATSGRDGTRPEPIPILETP